MAQVRDSIRNAAFTIREISETASSIDDVIRFDIGQPDADAPQAVKDRMRDVADEHATYTPLWGIPELRDMITDYESDKIQLTRENVMVTTGGTGALYCTLNTFLHPGDTVLMNDPAWPPYHMITAGTPGTYEQIPYLNEDGTINTAGLEDAIDDTTQAIILNTPENPTGHVYTEEQVKALCDIAVDHDLIVIADEVYDKLVYDDTPHYSPMEYVPGRTVLVNSLSKTFGMTGYRVGWAATPDEDLLENLGKMNRATTACPNYLSQQAALTALQEAQGYADTLVNEYRERRNYVEERLDALGWDYDTPQGTIYAFPDTGRDSWTFARTLLNEAGVAVVPGEPHGTASDTNIRLCFGSANMDQLEEGFDRIEAFL